MNCTLFVASIAVAFAAGCGATRYVLPAMAAEDITAQVIHIPELNGDALGPASPTGFRSKMFVSADGMTISVQDGNVPRHKHPNTNEIQYILEGTGTVWLGDKEVHVKPGDLIVIPKGTPHAGTKPEGRTFKAIAIKTPPQGSTDTVMLPFNAPVPR